MSLDKQHYYDGKFYEILIDPALGEVRDMIIEQIEAGSIVVDIGCGTGSLVFELAGKCESVTGVELSSKMVDHARRRQQANGKINVAFVHGDATNLPHFQDQQFDYLTISMALHEMPPALRIKVLNEAKRIAKKIIVADYVVPQPLSFAGIRTRIVEFLAGIEHFRGFRDFQNNNGIDHLLQSCQLSICSESTNKNGTIRVVVAEQ
ncbi:hypothetical protein CO046_05530 [Candidatus Peregrinibacteria bacterium CG_4_9_14_0_2_um_filter_53_11]|nr:MAG: hypothetical protein CO046_05530 [Candidatus Peregrinibacteria bacterium CG_4_9_14_0_2_um_filter_53_11]